MAEDTFKTSVGIFDRRTGEARTESGNFQFVISPDAPKTGGVSISIKVDRTSVIENFTGVMLLGKPYHMTRFTDHDGTGWTRFVDLTRTRFRV